jgi:hypothetical protein
MLRERNMRWRQIEDRLKEAIAGTDLGLVIELASGALLLAWMAHWIVE